MSRVFRRVLCALDLGPGSGPCLELARKIAGNETGVLLFHAIPMPIEALGQPVFVEPPAGAEHDAREALARLAAEASLQDYEIAVGTGDPAHEIVHAARQYGCDLIVVATHGRGGLGRLMLGSVAERVIRESTVPVLTIRPDHPGHPIAAGSILL